MKPTRSSVGSEDNKDKFATPRSDRQNENENRESPGERRASQFSRKVLTQLDALSVDSGSKRGTTKEEINMNERERNSHHKGERVEEKRENNEFNLGKSWNRLFASSSEAAKGKESVFYGKQTGPNTMRFEEVASIPLTNLIGRFLRDIVAVGKTFSLDLRLDDTPDGRAQISHLLEESKFAHKYTDRFAIRAQDEQVKREYKELQKILFARDGLSRSPNAQRLVVEDYQRIPETRRIEIENILTKTRAKDSYKVMDSKTYSEVSHSISGTPARSRFGSGANHNPSVPNESIIKPSAFHNLKPSTQSLYGQTQHQSGYPAFKRELQIGISNN